MKQEKQPSSRRSFLGTLATGAAAVGAATLAPLTSGAKTISEAFPPQPDDPEAWFKQIKGKHRMVFDVPQPNELMPFAWPRVFLMTNQMTGVKPDDMTAVVILRHSAIPYAMEDRLWAKYDFGKVFKADDPATKTASLRNPFWKPKKDEYKIPGIGPVQIGINELQQSGVLFGVCSVALTVYSAAVAAGMKENAADVEKDFRSGLLPGIQVMPSGVWAVGRAQEHGCTYCFAG
jgi:intracellular sulfur oxidation DsrE/DsrF family protein